MDHNVVNNVSHFTDEHIGKRRQAYLLDLVPRCNATEIHRDRTYDVLVKLNRDSVPPSVLEVIKNKAYNCSMLTKAQKLHLNRC